MNPDKINALKAELRALLEKYDVSIGWRFDDATDTHGIYGEGVEVVDRRDNVLFYVDGMSMDASDLRPAGRD